MQYILFRNWTVRDANKNSKIHKYQLRDNYFLANRILKNENGYGVDGCNTVGDGHTWALFVRFRCIVFRSSAKINQSNNRTVRSVF